MPAAYFSETKLAAQVRQRRYLKLVHFSFWAFSCPRMLLNHQHADHPPPKLISEPLLFLWMHVVGVGQSSYIMRVQI